VLLLLQLLALRTGGLLVRPTPLLRQLLLLLLLGMQERLLETPGPRLLGTSGVLERPTNLLLLSQETLLQKAGPLHLLRLLLGRTNPLQQQQLLLLLLLLRQDRVLEWSTALSDLLLPLQLLLLLQLLWTDGWLGRPTPLLPLLLRMEAWLAMPTPLLLWLVLLLVLLVPR
jgi:hypothetical protein